MPGGMHPRLSHIAVETKCVAITSSMDNGRGLWLQVDRMIYAHAMSRLRALITECDLRCAHGCLGENLKRGGRLWKYHGKWPQHRLLGMQEPVL